MPVSEGFRRIEVWASDPSADRTDPEDMTLTPPIDVEDGYDHSFSTPNGNRLRRSVWNELLHRFTSALVYLRTTGVPEWDMDVDTNAGGIKQHNGRLHQALVANGPTYGNAISPTGVGQTVWAEVTGTLASPSVPEAPQATTPRTGELDWFWRCPLDGGAMVTEFEFRWRVSGTMDWSNPVTVNYPRYVLTGLTNGTAIDAQVRATNSEGSSDWSTTGTATPSGEVPERVATLRATAGNAQAVLDWLEPDDGGVTITSYTVQWRDGNQVYSAGRQATTMTLGYTVTSLVNGTEYFFRVRAVNSEGAATWSNEASATPAAPVPDTAVPDRAAVPTGLAGNGQATWAWPAPSDNGADIADYEFRFRRTGTTSWTTRTVTLPYRTEAGLTNGQAYEAQVRARNSVGVQPSWSPSGNVTPRAERPDQVQRVAAVNRPSDVALTWGVPEANGAAISRYDIQHDTNSAFSSATTLTSIATSRNLTGIVEGSTVYVRVRAVNSAGNGAWSPTVSIVRDDGRAVPAAPTGLVGTPRRPLIVDWTWATPDDNGDRITGYDLQWRLSGAAWSGNVISVTVGSASHTIPNTTTAVQARVRARNSQGAGGWSTTVTVAAAALLGPIPRLILHLGSARTEYVWPYSDVSRAVVVLGRSGWVLWVNGSEPRASRVSDFSGARRVYALDGLVAGDRLRPHSYGSPGGDLHIFPQPNTA